MGHAYIPLSQPDHVDFPSDWVHPPMQLMHRSIFIGSRAPLALPSLSDRVPSSQPIFRN